jgi:predicted RNA-binding protein YlqC (UPF0109 family)
MRDAQDDDVVDDETEEGAFDEGDSEELDEDADVDEEEDDDDESDEDDDDDESDEDDDDDDESDEDDDDDESDEDDDDDEESDDDEELELGTALMRLVGLLVDHPEDARILEEVDARGETVFTVQVAPDDLGKLIGRQGRTARSLRNFLDARGRLDGHRYLLEIREQ